MVRGFVKAGFGFAVLIKINSSRPPGRNLRSGSSLPRQAVYNLWGSVGKSVVNPVVHRLVPTIREADLHRLCTVCPAPSLDGAATGA